ncbi:MAG: nucleotide exchange factor GrpE [Scytonematopsis contorta HA4267-MV1]|nr:nucleotide exchange factor GrpE [Scytonematopsis contorta HA4267-MV1]
MTNNEKLQELMQRVGISSYKALGQTAGVSKGQILQLRRGNITVMRLSILLKLSQALRISLDDLVTAFSGVSDSDVSDISLNKPVSIQPVETNKEQDLLQKIDELKQEYQRLQNKMEVSRQESQQEFILSNLQLLESLLLQFPTAAQKAQENPQLAAVKILPLVQKPLEKLLNAWGVEAIALVGAEIPYDPQWHQLLEGTAQPGESVKVRYTGYRQGDKLLYRAKVSP